MEHFGSFEKEDFARAEARQKALAFLDNPELLRMYALANEDSIPGARLHFTKLLCGFEDEEQKHTGPQPGLSSASNTRQHQADRRRGGDSHRSSTN
ncbi:hypothetical protein N656DRAFT_394417 [Canariomyces notabilis]|uniref:Uncharacterized protein n=1 Tax=Canariomyces notabilis TaxID=2074819 RepID=A0AAN6TJN8_9PEZI|nr:hypothetical protein N656DRAFT_394417 [Canariomyces arenarius]